MIGTHSDSYGKETPKVNKSHTIAKLADIDASVKVPFIFFTTMAITWLLVGSILAVITSIALHNPSFLPNWEFLTTGRIRSAHLNAVAYGWSNNAVFAVATWVMLRLCQDTLKMGWMLIIAGAFWNLATLAGILSILSGFMTSVEWLEMPSSVAPMLALSYLIIGLWVLLSFKYREGKHVYVSQWYILAAFFWFPWIYTAVQSTIFWFPARGVIQSLANWWFAHNALGLWYTPVGIATVYYLMPKVLGRPIHSYYLSVIGFWSLALFYNWAGVHHLIGGPIPVWVTSAGIVASIFMVIPVVVTGINHHLTAWGNFTAIWSSPTLRFIVFGAMNYSLSSLLGSTMALREVNEVTHFTHFTVAHAHHGAYGFFAMVMFGAIYYIMPRMLQKEWPSANLIRVHFWCSAVGISIYVILLSTGGWIQGLEMKNASIPFLDVVRHTIPYLISRTVGGVLMTIGHIAFFIHFVWIFFYKCENKGPVSLSIKPKKA